MIYASVQYTKLQYNSFIKNAQQMCMPTGRLDSKQTQYSKTV